jgi:hypothetical protein
MLVGVSIAGGKKDQQMSAELLHHEHDSSA